MGNAQLDHVQAGGPGSGKITHCGRMVGQLNGWHHVNMGEVVITSNCKQYSKPFLLEFCAVTYLIIVIFYTDAIFGAKILHPNARISGQIGFRDKIA